MTDSSGYRTNGFVTISKAIRSHSKKAKLHLVLKKIMKRNKEAGGQKRASLDSGERGLFLLHTGSPVECPRHGWETLVRATEVTNLHLGLPVLGLIF